MCVFVYVCMCVCIGRATQCFIFRGLAASSKQTVFPFQLLLYEETKGAEYLNSVKSFMTQCMPGGTVNYTPCGLVSRSEWGTNRYAGKCINRGQLGSFIVVQY